MDFKTTLDKIKQRGHWWIHVYPNRPPAATIADIAQGKQIMQGAAVELRGWDYPHYPTKTDEFEDLYVVGDHIEAWIDWERHKEIWRLFATGQFMQIRALREDWLDEAFLLPASDTRRQIPPGSNLEVIGTTYELTELFLFLRNMADAGLYDEGVNVDLQLRNTKDRVLTISDRSRGSLYAEYRCRAERVALARQSLSREDIIDDTLGLARRTIVALFKQFNWDNPPVEVIEADQRKLVERRL